MEGKTKTPSGAMMFSESKNVSTERNHLDHI